MSLLTRAFSNAINAACSVSSKVTQNVKCSQNLTDIKPGGLYNVVTRGIIRDHFPKPSERKRIKRHGWQHRMSTPQGRRILMNRILKGRFIYSH